MPEPQKITVDAGKLFGQKLLIAFLVVFVPTFLAAVSPILDSVLDALSTGGTIDFNLIGSLVLAAVWGAVAAGARAAMMLIPGLNLTPSDKLHAVGSPPPVEVTAVKH